MITRMQLYTTDTEKESYKKPLHTSHNKNNSFVVHRPITFVLTPETDKERWEKESREKGGFTR